MQELVQQKQLEIQQRDSRLMMLQEKVNFLTAEFEKLRNSFQVKEQLLTDVEKELNASKAVIESLKRKGKAEEDAAAKNAQLEELACKLDEGMKQLVHVDEERRVAVAEVEQERAKSRALYEQLSALENDHQMLKSELKRIMDDREETEKLKSEKAELANLNARLRQEVDLARAAISEARKVEAESSRLRREVADGCSRVTELEAEVARLQNQQQPADDDLPAVAKKERRAVQRSGVHLLATSHVCVFAHVCLLTHNVPAPSQRHRHLRRQPLPTHPLAPIRKLQWAE
jgi:chromosome segregation ATPase